MTESSREQHWQATLLAAIADPGWAPHPGYPANALAVYRNNYRVGLMEWLAQLYPICRQLVGDDFFEALAREFVKATPSAGGNVHRYGGELAAFVAHFPPCAAPPYLPDVARLEWALHSGYYAAQQPALDVSALAAIPPAQWGALRLALQPWLVVISSAWPLADIHAWHQPGAEQGALDLDHAQCVLLWREHGQMRLQCIAPALGDWLQQLQAGATLDTATHAALAHDAGFDLQQALLLLLTRHCLTGATP